MLPRLCAATSERSCRVRTAKPGGEMESSGCLVGGAPGGRGLRVSKGRGMRRSVSEGERECQPCLPPRLAGPPRAQILQTVPGSRPSATSAFLTLTPVHAGSCKGDVRIVSRHSTEPGRGWQHDREVRASLSRQRVAGVGGVCAGWGGEGEASAELQA